MTSCAIKGSNLLLRLKLYVGKGQNAGAEGDVNTTLTSVDSTRCLPRPSMQIAAVAAQAAKEQLPLLSPVLQLLCQTKD